MAKDTEQKTFQIQIDDLGLFEFKHRAMRDELRIGAEYSRLTEGVDTPAEWFGLLAEMMSALKVLTVKAPDGWDMDAMDPLDGGTYDKIMRVFSALREKERFFRKGPGQDGQTTGPEPSGEL